jgi:hypothetical protein
MGTGKRYVVGITKSTIASTCHLISNQNTAKTEKRAMENNGNSISLCEVMSRRF